VIRRGVTLLPGELASTEEADESKRRLNNTGLFFTKDVKSGEEAVRIRFVDTDQPDKADAVVEVTEGGMGNFSVGAGVSSSLGVQGTVRLTFENFDAQDFPRSWRQLLRGDAFSGGGQKLTLSLSPGTELRDYRLSWMNPSVWDSPYSVGFDAYVHDFNWTDYYNDGRVGLGFSVGREFDKDLRVSLAPKFERISITSLDDNAPQDAVETEGNHTRVSLALAASCDRRDNVFLTAKGYKLGGGVEMAGTALPGDVNYLKETFEARKWWTVWDQTGWGKHVLNLGGELAMMQSTEPGRVPMFDRLFLGGLGSLRGFQYRRVGPVDFDTGKQIGGQYRFTANGEYEAPLIRDVLRGVLFTDAGALGMNVSELGELRAAIGVGARLRLPFFGMQKIPLSIYFATPVMKRDNDQTEVFSFTMGTGFEF
jgi:outer membrane protein insertion porin family